MLLDPKWEKKLDPPKAEPWRKVLLDAADILETRGWIRGSYFAAGRHCMIGAMQEAVGTPPGSTVSGNKPGYLEAINKLSAALGTSAIAAWNDSREDAATVIRFLRETAGAP